jgi:hypothetical protein
MSLSLWLTAAALALLPFAATAQQTQQSFHPADANAPVPASGYVSSFKGYRAAVDEKTSPDEVWRAANEEEQGQGEHSGHAMNPGSGPGSSAPKADTGSGSRQDEQRPAAPKAAPHAGHASHNNKGK